MRYLVAVPVFNEGKTLRRVLTAIQEHANDVLVIDDGSTDDTRRLLAEMPDVCQVVHPVNEGYGQSIIDAFRFADSHGYDWVITMDCDEQHEPEQIPEFVAAATEDVADVISGSRYLRRYEGDDPPPVERRRINHTINQILAQTLNLHLTDSFCGFKAHRVAAMRRLALDETGYAFPLQFWVQAVRTELRIRELPVRRIYRDASRTFGGMLDDPAARLQHYLEVFVRELRRSPTPAALLSAGGCVCEK